MILSFKDQATEDIYDGADSRAARRALPVGVWRVAQRKLAYLNAAALLGDLRTPPGNRLQKLEGERGGKWSIRINDQYRICFRWTDVGPSDVEIVDYH